MSNISTGPAVHPSASPSTPKPSFRRSSASSLSSSSLGESVHSTPGYTLPPALAPPRDGRDGFMLGREAACQLTPLSSLPSTFLPRVSRRIGLDPPKVHCAFLIELGVFYKASRRHNVICVADGAKGPTDRSHLDPFATTEAITTSLHNNGLLRKDISLEFVNVVVATKEGKAVVRHAISFLNNFARKAILPTHQERRALLDFFELPHDRKLGWYLDLHEGFWTYI